MPDHTEAERVARKFTSPYFGYRVTTAPHRLATAYLDVLAQLREAEKDSERMDWMETNAGDWSVGFVALRGKWKCDGPNEELLDQRFTTARAAIDAARTTEEGK